VAFFFAPDDLLSVASVGERDLPAPAVGVCGTVAGGVGCVGCAV